jgi:hypothetical protein
VRVMAKQVRPWLMKPENVRAPTSAGKQMGVSQQNPSGTAAYAPQQSLMYGCNRNLLAASREEKPGKGWGRPCTDVRRGDYAAEIWQVQRASELPPTLQIEHGPSAAIYPRFWRGAAAQSARHRPSWRRLHSQRPARRPLPHSDRLRETCAIRACSLSLIDWLPFRHG